MPEDSLLCDAQAEPAHTSETTRPRRDLDGAIGPAVSVGVSLAVWALGLAWLLLS